MGLTYEPYSEPFSAGVREMRKRDAEGRQGRETKKGDKEGRQGRETNQWGFTPRACSEPFTAMGCHSLYLFLALSLSPLSLSHTNTCSLTHALDAGECAASVRGCGPGEPHEYGEGLAPPR